MATAIFWATLLPAFEWLQHTYLGETIRHSAALIALLEIIHLIGMALLLGTILMVDSVSAGSRHRTPPGCSDCAGTE